MVSERDQVTVTGNLHPPANAHLICSISSVCGLNIAIIEAEVRRKRWWK